MKTIIAALAMLTMSCTGAFAASALNSDSEARTIVVTEGGSQSEIAIGPGETVQFCPSGCFVTMPNGDREVLSGDETIEISGGRGRIR